MKTENSSPNRVAFVYGVTAGIGGLGHSIASAVTALAGRDADVLALGPGHCDPWSLPGGVPKAEWRQSPPFHPGWKSSFTLLRWRRGKLGLQRDRELGEWAAGQVRQLRPYACYAMTQVGLETFRWARETGAFSVADNPNGHIRNFQQVCERESQRWCGTRFHGHPTSAMVDRVEEEYELATYTRVYSKWGKRSMMSFGVPADRIRIGQQTVNLDHFRPPANKQPSTGPLRICFVGSLDLRKGFVYLLRAIRSLGAHVNVEIVGATGDRDCAQLFARERKGLPVLCAPGNPLPVYHRSDIFVLPTLEDGLPFVLPEAMACGLPVIISDQCGAGECVVPGVSGWTVPAADAHALTAALEKAIDRRNDLPEMGRQARLAVEQYCGPKQLDELAAWFYREARTSPSERTQGCPVPSV